VVNVSFDRRWICLAVVRAERHWVHDHARDSFGARILGISDVQIGGAARARAEEITVVDDADVSRTGSG